MAEKKSVSRAQRAAEPKKSTSASKAGAAAGKKAAPKVQKESNIPLRIVLAIVSACLFALFLVISIRSDGAVMQLIQSVVLGLVGQASFYFAIPGFLYLFFILISSRKRPVRMRCICVIAFVLTCGCIYHLSVNNQTFAGGISLIASLYREGIAGSSGGVICGMIAMILRWALGSVFPFIVLGAAAILTLLGAMSITVPGILRAIENMPRDEFEEEEETPEPAAIMVNHIAAKRAEMHRQRRIRMEEAAARAEQEELSEPVMTRVPEQKKNSRHSKSADLMSQIDDISDPVAASGVPAAEEIFVPAQPAPTQPVPAAVPVPDPIPEPIPAPEPIPRQMPAFVPDLDDEPEPEEVPKKVTAKDTEESARQVADEIAQGQQEQHPVYYFPPIDLLQRPGRGTVDGTTEMKENSRRLNETLESFKIDAHIVNVTRGPSVTRYEVELEKGVRLNKLTGCADDIALSLGASGVRIAAVPGKISVVGIEVPNKIVTNVHLREVIDSPEFNRAKSKSSFAVGKDIAGKCIIGNIAKMPHMLIAGTTGSGKSVCMNSIIISLLYKAGPEDVKLIMVDPKMVELGIYNGIPHLLIPVVTDPKKAAGSLQWAVTEMMRRYKFMSDAGVRDLESYNSIVESQEVEGEKLPQVVVIIDELADLMLVAAKEVEDSICRIAQMGRAAGMHLIIATQRPSADVITGLMKANIPSRIAFAVASAMESRIILDTQGAEKLVGKGDMLYAPIGTGKPQRVQGCFVTDSEVEAVAGYVKEHYNASYDESVMDEIEKKAASTGKKAEPEIEASAEEMEGDEMFPQAVDVILETGQASVSMLQRRLKLGYARAARIVDEMEEKGIVGPFQGSKPRSILITKEQWNQKKEGGSRQMDFDDVPFDEDVPEELD